MHLATGEVIVDHLRKYVNTQKDRQDSELRTDHAP